jgi:hypothetical protein
VLHRYFVEGEWVRQDDYGHVIDENGHILPDFWQIQGRIARGDIGEARLTGWAIHRATAYSDGLDFQTKTGTSGRPIHVAATPLGECYSIQKPPGLGQWECWFEGIVIAQSTEKWAVWQHANVHFMNLSLQRLDAATAGSADTAGSGVSAETPNQKGGPDA